MCVSKNLFLDTVIHIYRYVYTAVLQIRSRIRADPELDSCGSGAGFVRIRIICPDPEPDLFQSLWIRIRVQNLSKNTNNTLKSNNRIRSQIRICIRFIEILNKDPDPYQMIRLRNTGLPYRYKLLLSVYVNVQIPTYFV